MIKSRNFVFTFNNYTIEDETFIQSLDARYTIYGREVAPTTGTPHLQGFIVFSNPRSLAAIRRLLRCHVEIARGNPSQCQAYSKKEEDYWEQGDCPQDRTEAGAREAERWESALSAAKTGDVEAIPADILLRYYGAIRRIGTDFQPSPDQLESTCGIWIHGEAGCGKTRTVFAAYPEAYPKGLNKWWCGYRLEPVVLFDDIDPTHGPWAGGFLKKWADRYPFIGESKGGSRKIRPQKFIVTSQYKIEDIWPDSETRDALNRRFLVIEKKINEDIEI